MSGDEPKTETTGTSRTSQWLACGSSTVVSETYLSWVPHRSIVTSVFGVVEQPNAYCGDCRGKGFDLSKSKNRHARKCQRCRGVGSVKVGSTKR